MNMVKMELGVGILPELVLQYPVDGVEIKHLEPKGFREIRLTVRTGGTLSFATQKFLETFSKELSREIDPNFYENLKPYLQ